MPFSLTDFSLVHQAVDSVSKIHGAYRAVDLLGKSLEQVQVPEDFDAKLRELGASFGGAYEGPSETTKNVVIGLETAANAKQPEDRDALLKLIALVISKLTVAQGTRLLSLLLAGAGLKPHLLILVIKVCFLAAQTRTGRRIVEAAEPTLEQVVATAGGKAKLVAPITELASVIGERGNDLMKSITAAPIQAAQKIADTGISFLDQLKPVDDKSGS